MTLKQQSVIDVFYNDIVQNAEYENNIVEYIFAKGIREKHMETIIEREGDRVAFFDLTLAITDAKSFTNELRKRLSVDFEVKFFDLSYDNCGNVENILICIEKRG